MGWESRHAKKLFQDDQEAWLVQNTTDSHDQGFVPREGLCLSANGLPNYSKEHFADRLANQVTKTILAKNWRLMKWIET